MFMWIYFVIVFAVVISYARRNNKGPKEFDNIPSVSGLPLAWGLLRQKSHDEIEDIIYESSKGQDIYYVRHLKNCYEYYILKMLIMPKICFFSIALARLNL